MNSKIIGTGSYIPPKTKYNNTFLNHSFLDVDGNPIPSENDEIINKFESITGIKERKYVSDSLTSSDIGFEASKNAIKTSNIDPETIDYIILAHNIGDVAQGSNQVDAMPSLASRVKSKLGIENPNCVAYDILFGCPGWLEGVIQAHAFIKAKMANRCLVIGSETLSRVIDPNDRDGMIFADGAGAVIIDSSEGNSGVLSHKTVTYSDNGEANYIFYGKSNNLKSDNTKYIKMKGRKVYEFALNKVPDAMKKCFDECGHNIKSLKKIFIHQANQKMDEAIIKRFYKLYNSKVPENILPMNIEEFGNSSTATIPTLLDLVIKENYNGHEIKKGDIILFASVGSGMNINAVSYQY
ncbi:MAG: ketoacyl-ACP synthase III [Flavobacteriaceae bacterium]|nr:ketoacyl-ACP synthase III [Flavobacteriaceae bacterium]